MNARANGNIFRVKNHTSPSDAFFRHSVFLVGIGLNLRPHSQIMGLWNTKIFLKTLRKKSGKNLLMPTGILNI